jgi:cob(I)alamin adenosyltransferase
MLGQTQIFYGNGKGKTTAALGTALRALGNNYKVHLIQFMKNKSGDSHLDNPGEIKSLSKFPNFSYKRFGSGSWVIGKPKLHHIEKVNDAFNYLNSTFKTDFDIIIADEILYAVQLGLLKESKVIDLINQKPKSKELILTGSHKPYPNIFKHADLITEVKKIKHPFDSGILARKGIEY